MDRKKTVGNEKIASLFDTGTFVEIGAYVKRCDADYDGVICGYGAIDGKAVFAFVQDSDRLMGALDATGAKKIEMLYELATKVGSPVIGVFDGSGAVVSDGSAALDAYGRVMRCIANASGLVPQIAVICGVCTGLSLTAATMFDFVLVSKENSKIYVTRDNGNSPILPARSFEDEGTAFAFARQLAGVLPLNNRDGADGVVADDPERAVSVSGFCGSKLVESIADNGKFIELFDEEAKEVCVGFAYFGGELCGIVASDRSVNDGKLSCRGAKKAATLVAFCDRFGIDVVTLVDSKGFGEAGCSAAYAALASAYANSTCGKITAIIGNAYGAAFTLLGSKSLGADIVYALEKSCISIIDPETAVAFMHNDDITAARSRKDIENEWIEKNATAAIAASKGNIDDIIPDEELRARICSALYLFATKADGELFRRSYKLTL